MTVSLRRRRVGALVGVGVGVVALAGCDLGAPPTEYRGNGTGTVTGDVNGDGHLDVLTLIRSTNSEVLFGDGNGGFTVGSVPYEFSLPIRGSVQLADANEDGFDDIFLMWHDPGWTPDPPCEDPRPGHCPPTLPPKNNYWLYLNDGGNRFGVAPVELHSEEGSPGGNDFPFPWTVADVTGDGHVDFVRAGLSSLMVRPGDGTGSFAAPGQTSSSPVLPLGEVQITDLDADGHDDIVVGGAANFIEPRAAIAVYWGNGTATLDAPTVVPLAAPPAHPWNGAGDVEIGDFDGDGHLDLLAVKHPVRSGEPAPELMFVRGDGTRSLAAPVSRTWPPEFGASSLAAGDFDGDGTDDAVQTTSRYVSEIEPRDRRGSVRFGGPGAALSESAFLAGAGLGTKVADVDADGRPDLLVPTDDGIRVFLNRWEGRP